MDQWSIVILGGVLLLFSFKGVILSHLFRFKTIKAKQAKILLKEHDAILVDVRTPEEYRAGHLPGSLSIPLSVFSSETANLTQNQHILLICQSGPRSLIAASKLGRAGFPKTYSVNGGLLGWS